MDKRLSDYLASLGADDSALDGWTIHTAQRAGQDVAFVCTRGAEIHLVSIVGKGAMSRKNIAQFIQPLLDEFGYAATRVPLSEMDHRLRHALGFTQTWVDEHYTYWTLTEAPYQKGARPCPSL